MAKVPSPFLTGATGKFAGAAFQQSPGNGTILREVVKPTNPSTEAQVEQRAKFKLMSQVATAFKSVIAMKREGNITPRNMFVKINSPLLSFDKAEKKASILLDALQLTKSNQPVSLQAAENVFTLSAESPILYGAVFVHVISNSDDLIVIKEIATEELEQAAQTVAHTFEGASERPGVVLAYGITQKSDGLKVKYDNYTAEDGDAYLHVLSALAENSALTKTAGVNP